MSITLSSLASQLQSFEGKLKEIAEVAWKGKEVSERIESNWDKDRKDFSDFSNRLGHLEQEFKSFKEGFERLEALLNKLPQQTQNKVAEVLSPAMGEVQDFKDAMKDKKVIALDPERTRKQVKRWYHWPWFL